MLHMDVASKVTIKKINITRSKPVICGINIVICSIQQNLVLLLGYQANNAATLCIGGATKVDGSQATPILCDYKQVVML